MEVNCYNCHKKMIITPSRLKNKVHNCSKQCMGITNSKIHSKKIITQCIICNKTIQYKQSHFKKIANHTCSHLCSAKQKKIINKGNGNPRSLKLSKEDRYFWNKALQIKSRAKALNIPYDLDWFFLKKQFELQNGLCYYSNIKLNKNAQKSKGQAGYDALSVDKIDANKGYTKDNIVFCINAVNMMKGSFNMNIFKKIISGLSGKDITALKTKKLVSTAVLPAYAKLGDAGLDLTATSVEFIKELNIYKYGTGISIQIPFGCTGLLYPRSSIFKYDLILSNSVGVLDCFYRNEIFFMFRPTKENPKIYNIGDRIGQLIVTPIPIFDPIEVEELDMKNDRGGGHGSTGV